MTSLVPLFGFNASHEACNDYGGHKTLYDMYSVMVSLHR